MYIIQTASWASFQNFLFIQKFYNRTVLYPYKLSAIYSLQVTDYFILTIATYQYMCIYIKYIYRWMDKQIYIDKEMIDISVFFLWHAWAEIHSTYYGDCCQDFYRQIYIDICIDMYICVCISIHIRICISIYLYLYIYPKFYIFTI